MDPRGVRQEAGNVREKNASGHKDRRSEPRRNRNHHGLMVSFRPEGGPEGTSNMAVDEVHILQAEDAREAPRGDRPPGEGNIDYPWVQSLTDLWVGATKRRPWVKPRKISD